VGYGIKPIKSVFPITQVFLSAYFLNLSGTGKEGLLLIILALGSITGVLDVDHTVRNSSKEEFSWLRLDTTLFLAGSFAVYHFRSQYDHLFLLYALSIPTLIYFSIYTLGIMITISRYLDAPFFSVKKPKST
jgi:hypothetical protein